MTISFIKTAYYFSTLYDYKKKYIKFPHLIIFWMRSVTLHRNKDDSSRVITCIDQIIINFHKLTGFSVAMLNAFMTRNARNSKTPIFHMLILLSVSETLYPNYSRIRAKFRTTKVSVQKSI